MTYSFEFFPPRTPQKKQQFVVDVEKFSSLNPNYVSVTYGALGSERESTFETIAHLKAHTDWNIVCHLTAQGHTAAEIDNVAERLKSLGVNQILALGGDTPLNPVEQKGDFKYAVDLIHYLKHHYDFDISVAGYPEVHPFAKSGNSDLEYLKLKVDAGASQIITQFCFQADVVLNYVKQLLQHNISVPVSVGILAIDDIHKIKSFAQKCEAHIPDWVLDLNPKIMNDQIVQPGLLLSHALIQYLSQLSDVNFHLYTFNNADLTTQLCELNNWHHSSSSAQNKVIKSNDNQQHKNHTI